MQTILVVDDDVDIGNLIEEVLTREKYRVRRAYSGTEAKLLLGQERPDLVLLDLMLPGIAGEDVLPLLSGIPVVVVSAKAGVDDKVALLGLGARDYITKPFDTRELLARVAVQLRAEPVSEKPRLTYGPIELDPAQRAVAAAGKPVKLTRTEYAILHLLMENPRQVLTKTQLREHISPDTPDCVESSLSVHVSNLRKKLRAAAGGNYIEAVWGIGFRLCGA